MMTYSGLVMVIYVCPMLGIAPDLGTVRNQPHGPSEYGGSEIIEPESNHRGQIPLVSLGIEKVPDQSRTLVGSHNPRASTRLVWKKGVVWQPIYTDPRPLGQGFDSRFDT